MAIVTPASALDSELQRLAGEYFAWRAEQQPAGGDDIPRVERPDGWVPDFSEAALSDYRAAYADYRARLDNLDRRGWSRADEVDALALSAAINRVHWELDVLKAPHRNPYFYVDQTLGSLFEILIVSSPVTSERASNIVARLEAIPTILTYARNNLTDPVRPFALTALDALQGVDDKLSQVAAALTPLVSDDTGPGLNEAARTAARALTDYAEWLAANEPSMSDDFNVGRDEYDWFLRNVALIPHEPEELLRQGQQAWQRAVAFESLEQLRNANAPKAEIFPDIESQIEAERRDELAIRDFLENNDLMTVPAWLQHYVNRPYPAYLAPLAHMGVGDDLTSATRLDEDAVSYIVPPGPDISYFSLASAQDPRPVIVHEGVPGHYFQMALSWRNPDPVRRHYIDSGANEGIGFYVEEMLLQAGLFDDRPRTREIIYSFMRLRALRVEVDIRLALGEFTIPQAAEYLSKTVPMDEETALEEARFFASSPGQAITYQIGKTQILKFMSDARLAQGEKFSIREFHDYLMVNGNLPISLLRWEYLNLDDEIRVLTKAR